MRKQKQEASPDSSTEMLAALLKLATDPDPRIRAEVARNASTQVWPDILLKLASDRKTCVRENVANNCSTPADALRQLAFDRKTSVRECVAYNPSTPVDALLELAGDRKVSVRRVALITIQHYLICSTIERSAEEPAPPPRPQEPPIRRIPESQRPPRPPRPQTICYGIKKRTGTAAICQGRK